MVFINNLKGYTIILAPSAEKVLNAIEQRNAIAIREKLKALVGGQQNLDVKKIVAMKRPTYRLRVGNYRVLYEIHEKEIVVKVIRIAHRKDAYDF